MLITVAIACTPADVRDADTARVDPPANERPAADRPELTADGLAALRIGMTIAEARAVLPRFELDAGADSLACNYARTTGLPAGVHVMLDSARIARIDVESTTVVTAEGAQVGDSDQRIRELYGERVTVTGHAYIDGNYLTVRGPSPGDTARALVFETDKQTVLRFRAGRQPHVGYVEGCS